MIEQIKRDLWKICFKWYQLTHPMEKQITFISFNGEQYSDNPRAICEKMHQMFPEYRLVWLVKDLEKNMIPGYVVAKQFSFSRLKKEVSKSFCFVTNCEIWTDFYKRKNQLFIQTWHADRSLKRVLFDARDDVQLYDDKVTDLCIAGSDFGINIFRSAFHYQGEILKKGSPRNDVLVRQDDNLRTNVKKKIGLHKSEKLLLYAPTFRDHDKSGWQVNVDLKKAVEKLRDVTGDNWKCAVRAHVGAKINGIDESVMELSDYPDMADLLLACDFLITDYSGSSGDFIITGKPMILTLYDIDDYTTWDRGILYDYADAGFIVAHNDCELLAIIENYTADDYKKSTNRLEIFFGLYETGRSSEAVCERMNEHYIRYFM